MRAVVVFVYFQGCREPLRRLVSPSRAVSLERRRTCVVSDTSSKVAVPTSNGVIYVSSELYFFPPCTRKANVPSKPSNDDIYFRDGGVCAYCRQKIARVEVTVDHITPRWAGGKSTWENLVCACKRCNNRKGGRTPAEAGMTLLHNPHIPNMHPSPALAYV